MQTATPEASEDTAPTAHPGALQLRRAERSVESRLCCLLDEWSEAALQATAVTSLEALPLHAPATIAALKLSDREATWLRAVGLTEGCLVTVLRKAPLSGPLHVRVDQHTELAIDRELALHVEVTPAAGAAS